jgi:ribosomal protein L35
MVARVRKRHTAAQKRFKKLPSGLIKAAHQGRRKKLTHKTRARKRALRKGFYLTGGDHKRVAKVI